MPAAIDSMEELDDDSPRDVQRRWQMEIDAAKKETSKFHKTGENIIKRYRDEQTDRKRNETHVNLFSSDIQTKQAMLYGKIPQVDVDRKYADANDDVGRISAEVFQRVLNHGVELTDDDYRVALKHCLFDRLVPGAGCAVLRYVVEHEEKEIEAITHHETGEVLAEGYTETVKVHEDVEVDHINWKDILWSPSRTWCELRWVAIRRQLSRKELVKRFGEVGKQVPLNSKKDKYSNSPDARFHDPRERADVWEIWSKDDRTTYWFVEGFDRILDAKKDPLGLSSFWPIPEPMFANLTTETLIPRPDFSMAQDLYNEIDEISKRVSLLVDSLSVRGLYDKTNEGLKEMFRGEGNKMIPVDNWAMLAEKGGIRGQVDWFPLDMVVSAMDKLREYRAELITLVQQVTGMSDIMRGQAAQAATATEQAIKARFASVRMQALQDEFARFATDIQRIKAEIIAKHFDPQTLLERANANMMPMADQQLLPQAIQLIKSEFLAYRIEVKPESVSMADMASLRSERMEFINGLGQFFKSVAPLAQAMPQAMPVFLQICQWAMASFKGAKQIEGVFDQAIAMAEQNAQQPAQQQPHQPDPKILAVQLKNQGDMQRTQAELQADLMRTKAETESEVTKQAAQAHFNVKEMEGSERAKAMAELAKLTNGVS